MLLVFCYYEPQERIYVTAWGEMILAGPVKPGTLTFSKPVHAKDDVEDCRDKLVKQKRKRAQTPLEPCLFLPWALLHSPGLFFLVFGLFLSSLSACGTLFLLCCDLK